MSNLWERFDNIVNPEEVSEAKNKFTPLEAGNYEMKLEEIAPAESQSGLPMIKGKFRTVEGNRVVFYNQMLQNLNNPNMTAVNVAEAVAFVSKLINEDIEFDGLSKFADIITGIAVGDVYSVDLSYGKNDFDMKYPKLKIKEKVSGETGFMNIPDGLDEELPFN